MNKIFLVSKSSLWSDNLSELLKSQFDCYYFNDDSYQELLSLQPDWVFFFHWSERVPKEIYKNNKCAIIHTGNLPKGRGGTPIQNQILDGIIESKVNIITMEEELDSGKVYCSLPITLQGSITDIWLSISERAHKLIKKCVQDNPDPKSQMGEVQIYRRNKNNELPLGSARDLIEIHKFIQMLDGKTYPKAFLRIGNFKLFFYISTKTL